MRRLIPSPEMLPAPAHIRIIAHVSLALVLACAPARAAESTLALKGGEKVAFLGDSITAQGWSQPGGYVRLVAAGLKANGVEITSLPAGVSGNSSKDMLARYSRDVLEKKPDWVTISCGVNDVWHGDRGVALEDYQKNMTSLVDQAQAVGIQVMLLTATPIMEEPENAFNAKLADYNAFLRVLAAEKHCLLADPNAAALAAIAAAPKPRRTLTVDGVHPNPHGAELIAVSVLEAFGFDNSQVSKARAAWSQIPQVWDVTVTYRGSSGAKTLSLTQALSRTDYERIEKSLAELSRPISVPEFLQDAFRKDVDDYIQPRGSYENIDAILSADAKPEVIKEVKASLSNQIADLFRKAPSVPLNPATD